MKNYNVLLCLALLPSLLSASQHEPLFEASGSFNTRCETQFTPINALAATALLVSVIGMTGASFYEFYSKIRLIGDFKKNRKVQKMLTNKEHSEFTLDDFEKLDEANQRVMSRLKAIGNSWLTMLVCVAVSTVSSVTLISSIANQR